MADKKRKQIPREIGSIDFEGMTAVEIIEYLQGKIKEYGKDIYVDTVYERYGESEYLALHEKVPESDSQYAQRILEEERWETARRESDIRQLKELQAKYGDNLA